MICKYILRQGDLAKIYIFQKRLDEFESKKKYSNYNVKNFLGTIVILCGRRCYYFKIM